MSSYPQWPYEFTSKLLNTKEKIFSPFIADIHNLYLHVTLQYEENFTDTIIEAKQICSSNLSSHHKESSARIRISQTNKSKHSFVPVFAALPHQKTHILSNKR